MKGGKDGKGTERERRGGKERKINRGKGRESTRIKGGKRTKREPTEVEIKRNEIK